MQPEEQQRTNHGGEGGTSNQAPGSERVVNKTSSGLEENIAGLLCYVLGFITGIIFLVLERENRFVQFHAFQSIVTFGGLFVLNMMLSYIPFIGWMFNMLLVPVGFVLWIFLMLKAHQGAYFKLPYIGDISQKLADSLRA